MKNLIIYYSYEGNTEALVCGMQSVMDADVLRLRPTKEKISKGLYRFVWGGMQVYMTKTPKLDPVYPLKNGIDAARKQVNDWILANLK